MKNFKIYMTFTQCIIFSICLQFVVSQHYYFQQQALMIPHPEKAHRGGEDAYFSSS
jgi:hypothetical protein